MMLETVENTQGLLTQGLLSKALLGIGLSKQFSQSFQRQIISFLKGEQTNRQAFDQALKGLDLKTWDQTQKILEEATKHGIHLLNILDTEYPQQFHRLSDPPLVIFVKGQLPTIEQKLSSFGVGVVGSRKASPYGLRVAHNLSAEIVSSGGYVISGLAYGVDTAAHKGALQVCNINKSDQTAVRVFYPGIAVLGSGICSIYPAENRSLAAALIENGGALISEFGLFNKPERHFFPMRNRLISALSDIVLVVEAAERSGALITARLALEQGKDVAAVPGPIDSPQSVGCNRLIQSGAALVNEFSDLCQLLPRIEKLLKSSLKPKKNLTPSLEQMYEAIKSLNEPEQSAGKLVCEFLYNQTQADIDSIIEATSLSLSEVNQALALLELNGVIFRTPGHIYSLSEYA